ncbi:G-protein coupled receptor 20, partial [Eschrichtius robustus]|nr:G-protein coupled receptor 20 [Eschrichtius robustus]
MPSASSAGPSAMAAPNATAAAAAWTNISMPETPLFHLFALLDEELHAAFPGLWLALMAVHGVIFLVGLVLNGLALYVFGCRTQAKTPSIIYTINLVVTDLLVGLSLPARFAVFYGTRGCLRCALPHVFGYFLNMHCSILFLTCICVDRYLAIVQPNGCRRWRQPACARAVCAFVWLAAGAVTLSVLGVTATGGPCCRVFALTVLEFLLPLLVISVFTGRVVGWPQSWQSWKAAQRSCSFLTLLERRVTLSQEAPDPFNSATFKAAPHSRPSRRAGPPPHPVDEDTEAEEGTSLGAKFPAGSDTVVSWHRLLTWRRLPGPPPPSQSP